MPLVDFNKFHGQVMLSADRRNGVWANQVILNHAKSVRTAGQAPTSTTAHGLQTLALVNALKGVSKRQARHASDRLTNKTSLLIVTTDSTFVDALRALIERDKKTLAAKRFRAGRNLFALLARELARFEVTLETDLEDAKYQFRALSNWAKLQVRDPREIEKLPKILSPVAVSHVV